MIAPCNLPESMTLSTHHFFVSGEKVNPCLLSINSKRKWCWNPWERSMLSGCWDGLLKLGCCIWHLSMMRDWKNFMKESLRVDKRESYSIAKCFLTSEPQLRDRSPSAPIPMVTAAWSPHLYNRNHLMLVSFLFLHSSYQVSILEGGKKNTEFVEQTFTMW